MRYLLLLCLLLPLTVQAQTPLVTVENEDGTALLTLSDQGGNTGQLSVIGSIHSTTGGFVFPDATTQTTATTNSGVASSRLDGASVPCCGTLTPLLSRSINVPTSGYVIALAGTEAQVDHVFGRRSSVHFGISDAPSSLTAYSVQQYDTSFPGGRHVLPIAVHGVYPVSAGTHTFYFMARHDPGLSEGPVVSIFEARLTLLFVPAMYETVMSSSTFDEMSSEEVLRERNGDDAAVLQANGSNTGALVAEIETLRAEIDALKQQLRTLVEAN